MMYVYLFWGHGKSDVGHTDFLQSQNWQLWIAGIKQELDDWNLKISHPWMGLVMSLSPRSSGELEESLRPPVAEIFGSAHTTVMRFSTRIYQVPWRVQFVMVEGCLKVGAYLQVTGILNIIFIGNMIAWHWLTSGFGQTLILIWLTLLDIAERPQIWDPSGSFASVPGAETHELCNADQLSGTRAGLHEDVEGQQWTHRDGSSFKLGGQTISKLISKPFTFTRNTRNMFSWMIVPW